MGFNGQIHVSKDVLCQYLYIQESLHQCLKMRAFEVLGIGSGSRAYGGKSTVGTMHKLGLFIRIFPFRKDWQELTCQ